MPSTLEEYLQTCEAYAQKGSKFWDFIGVGYASRARVLADPRALLSIKQLEKAAYFLNVDYNELHNMVRIARDSVAEMTPDELAIYNEARAQYRKKIDRLERARIKAIAKTKKIDNEIFGLRKNRQE